MENLNVAPTTKVPGFLKVLCILTFISSGLGTVGALFSLLTASSLDSSLEQAVDLYSGLAENSSGIIGEFFLNMVWYLEAMIPVASTMYLANFILTALSLIGAVLMYKLKKLGFHMYTAANLFLLSVPVVLLGTNFIVLAGVGINAIFTIGFIVMYALNLKHLN